MVLVSIPCSLTFALVALWLTGNTLNIMSLGGLALAIGILVDEAVVTIENTHAQMLHTDSVARAARRASAATATARLLAMLCILSVFIPTFILNEPVRSLFMPLTLAVGFSMIASYLLSSTLVPVLSVWLVRHKAEHAAEKRPLRQAAAGLQPHGGGGDPAALDCRSGILRGLRAAVLAGRHAR